MGWFPAALAAQMDALTGLVPEHAAERDTDRAGGGSDRDT